MSNHEEKTTPDNLDEAKGRAKQAYGELTGDEEVKREGEADEASGDVKSMIDDVADKAKDAVDNVKSRLTD